jgi:hypothetical protein
MLYILTPSSAICSSTPLFELEKTLQAFMRSIVSSVGLRLTHANIAITRIRRAMPDAMFICYVGNIIRPYPT